jgi:hypothetical protein
VFAVLKGAAANERTDTVGRTDTARVQVELMLEQRASFENIEAYIDGRRDLPPAAKSALWLLAWAETSREERRAVAREMVTLAELGELGAVRPRRRRSTVSPVRRR